MPESTKKPQKLFLRALIEIGFILFLFYANLLMGEFTVSNGEGKELWFAVSDMFTLANFGIGLSAACVGFGVFEYLRRRL